MGVSSSGLYGAEVNIPGNPVVHGYTFTGWDKADLQVFGSESQTIIACWDADADTRYTIREYLQTIEGGNNYSLNREYQEEGSFSPYTKTGFEFTKREPLHIDSNGNAILNVYWNRLSYTVTFNTMGGSYIPSQQVLYYAKVQLPQVPIKSDYSFYKWYTDYDCNNPFDNDEYITSAKTLYAFWIDPSVTYEFHENVERLQAGTDGTFGTAGEYVLFGDYPQSKKTDNTITIDENKITRMGDTTVYGGSDGNLYYKYSSGYYKVEPIKWRVISRDRNNIAVLLAENILEINYYDWDDFGVFGGSDIRDYLNGYFLNTAFTSIANNQINTVRIDSYEDLYPHTSCSIASRYVETQNKLYLLSYSEVNDHSIFPNDNSKIRTYTGLSAEKVWLDDLVCWWLRSFRYTSGTVRPYNPYCVWIQYSHGTVSDVDIMLESTSADCGVVPALSIYLPPEN